MLKLWTKEKKTEGIPLLGELLSVQSHCRILLRQRITIPGAGRFIRQKTLGLLNERAMIDFQEQRGGSFGENDCLGVALPGEPRDAIGQVSLADGWYQYHLPVAATLSLDRHWKTRGYLPMDNGKFIRVARRSHAGRWVIGILLALLLGGAGYLVAIYGWNTVWRTVCATVNGWISG